MADSRQQGIALMVVLILMSSSLTVGLSAMQGSL
ncbi:hypothetical protein LOKO_01579 [Halomonas chromatireducens]|uniref:Type 4 fimbrial biogenesis protein PilX N-terminal domain-containing protein n=1 Tax=Halomonas chromatireducens TaxID=507626 RepID=A0A0X8HDJ5_9GAMM|nr:hypothetical protein LOKO_01579 [Halomonas chromatireducens]